MLSATIKHTLRYRTTLTATKVTLRNLSSSPITVKVSPSEVTTKSLTWKNLELATRALHRDGLVVLEDVIDHDKLDFLNKKMIEDALFLQSAGDESPYNYNKGYITTGQKLINSILLTSNIQQDPPATEKYFDPEIFLNPLATQLTSSLLGPKPCLSFLSANSALPPTPTTPPQSQPVHSDADFAHPHCPFALVINIPLVTMTPENGSTEVWLGTHAISSEESQEGKHGERASGRIKEELLLEREAERGPVQPVVRKGSVVVRDLRLWHAGMPNFSRDVRVMLAMIHFAPWFRNQMKVEMSEDLRPLIEGYKDVLQIQTEFMPEKQVLDRYLARGFGNSYDFDQVDRLEVDI